jgi:hypothetical protein
MFDFSLQFEDFGESLMTLLRLTVTLNAPGLEGVGSYGLVVLVIFVCLANIGVCLSFLTKC